MNYRLTRIWALLFVLAFESSASAFAAPRVPPVDIAPPCAKTEEHSITVDRLRVHYIETGTGPTLVMIHGNAGAVEDFTFGTIGLLCGNYRIVAVDRAGHGKSERPSGKTPTLEYQADLLHQTLTHLGITEPVLVGHSWGAALALAYALKYRQEVSGLVLLAPAAYADKGGNKLMRMAITPPLIGDAELLIGKLLFGRRVLTHELARAFYPEPVPKDYLKMASSSWLTRRHLKSYLEDEWTLNASLKALSKRYSEINVPVVIVTGDEDKVVSPKENAYRLKAAISQAQLIEVKGAGHEIPQSHPETVDQAMRLVSASAAANRR
jgi:pimeloyl-ACP methyl ester carboxylesterase